MEAITWAFLGRILVPILEGVAGNLATSLINSPARYIRGRLSTGTPAARLVEREVSVALLRATTLACRIFKQGIRSADRADRRALREWFYRAEDFLIGETARVQQAPHALFPAGDMNNVASDEALLTLLRGEDHIQPDESPATAVTLAAMIEAYLANHIEMATPNRFQELLTEPWLMSRGHRDEYTSWFETAKALFSQRLDNNEHLRTAVTNLLLTDLTVSVDKLATSLADSSVTALSRIDDAMSGLARLETALGLHAESAARLEGWVSKLLEVALLQPPEQGRAVTVLDVLEALRHDAARSARGLWAGERTEELLKTKSSCFVGREELLDELDGWLSARPSGFCVVAGRAGMGKSSLLAHWISTRRGTDVYFCYHFFSETRTPLTDWSRGVDNLIRQVQTYYGVPERAAGVDRPDDQLYDLIRQEGMAAQPLVIVLDAVDESNQRDLTDLPFPRSLPANVYVLVSARGAEGEIPPYLDWAKHTQVDRLDLRPFSIAETSDYLSSHGVVLADRTAAERIHRRTNGYPLFTGYLVETIADQPARGSDLTSLLASVPQTFSAFVKGELQRIDLADLRDAAWRLLTTLAVALGPLQADELMAAAHVVDVHFSALVSHRQLVRWIRAEANGGEPEYVLDHPAIGEAIRQSYGESAVGAESALVARCAEWWPRGGGYALRHYPSHLLNRARRDRAGPEAGLLYTLINEQAFVAEQERVLPYERDLPLRTILAGVQCAIDHQEVAQTIAFALGHARKKRALTRLSPLLEEAPTAVWGLADLAGPSVRSLWLLLLAWLEVIRGDDEGAGRTIEHLLDGEVAPLTGLESESALLILSAGLSNLASLDRLAEQLLTAGARTRLLIETAHLPEAEAAALALTARHQRSEMLEKIAIAWAGNKQFAEADRVIRIRRAQDQINGFPDLALDLSQIEPARAEYVAEARRRGENPPGSFDDPTLQLKVDIASLEGQATPGSNVEQAALHELVLRAVSVDDPYSRAMALAEVGAAQSRASDEEAAATFALALAAALASTSGQQALAGTVWRVADWQAECMGVAAAAHALARAGQEAKRVDPEWQRGEALSRVAETYARAGGTRDAERLLADITDPLHRTRTLTAIALSRPSAEQSRALEEIELALQQAWRVAGADGVAPIIDCAAAFARTGERERAQTTLRDACERILTEDGSSREPRLLALARVEIQLGAPEFAIEALTGLLLGPRMDSRHRAEVAGTLIRLAEVFEAAGRQPRASELRSSAAELALSLAPGRMRVQALADLIPIIALSERTADLDRIVSTAVGDFTEAFGAFGDDRSLEGENDRLRLGQELRNALLEINSAEAGRVDLGWAAPLDRQWGLQRRVARLAECGRFAEAEALTEVLEAEEMTERLGDRDPSVSAWAAIGAARIRLHDRNGATKAWQRAKATALEIPDLSIRVQCLITLAANQVDSGFTDFPEAVLTEAADALRQEVEHPVERPQSKSLRLAAEAMAIEARALPPDQMSTPLVQLVSDARAISRANPRERSKALICIAAVQGRAGLVADADATLAGLRADLDDEKQESWRSLGSNRLLMARVEAAMGHREHARADVADEIARTAGERFQGLEFRVRSLAGIVWAAAKAGLVDEAEDARQMAWAMAEEAADVRQQVSVVAAIAEHEQLAGFGREADRHFADARRMTDAIIPPTRRIRALIELGEALGRARRADEALAALSNAVRQADVLQQALTRVETLCALGKWQLEFGLATQAARTASQLTAAARDLRGKPHRWQHDNPLRRAVGVVACINGRKRAAVFELEIFPDEFLHHNAGDAVVKQAVGQAQAGDLQAAREYLGTKPFAGGWWRGLEAIADTLSDQGALTEASEVYAQAAEAAQHDPGLSTGEESRTALSHGLEIAALFARLGDSEAALRLIAVRPDAADPPRVASEFAPQTARILTLASLPQLAERLLDQALEAAVSEPERDLHLAQVAEVQAMLPDVDRFFSIVQQINDPHITARLLGRVAVDWARKGRIPEALLLASQIHADQGQSILPLAEELAKAGRRQELMVMIGRHADEEVTLTLCPILAQMDSGSLDGIADALLRLSVSAHN